MLVTKFVQQSCDVSLERVRKWLRAIAEGLDESKSILLENMAFERPIEMYDARQEKLALEALGMLPGPLRTLLVALEDLKKDTVRDKCRQVSNYENKVIAYLQGRIDFACASLNECSKGIHEAMNTKSILDERLLQDLSLKIDTTGGPLDMQATLKAKMHSLQKEAQTELLLAHEKKPHVVLKPVFQNTYQQAILESQHVRQRLRQLASGHLDLQTIEKPVAAVLDDEPLKSIQPKTIQSDIHDEIIALKQLLRRLKFTIDQRHSDQQLLISDYIGACVHGLRHASVNALGPMQIIEHEDMLKADESLQKEISMILQTLSIDRQALDLVLRAIKNQCTQLEESAAMESTGAWSIRLATWQLRLTEALQHFESNK